MEEAQSKGLGLWEVHSSEDGERQVTDWTSYLELQSSSRPRNYEQLDECEAGIVGAELCVSSPQELAELVWVARAASARHFHYVQKGSSMAHIGED